MISEEMAAQMADSSMNRVEIVDDPDAPEVQEADTVVEQTIDTVQTKPPVQPPVVHPPVVRPPVVQPPVTPPPTQKDTLKDSLSIK
jgi:hypothetical protein